MNDVERESRRITFLSDQPLGADREQEMRFGHPSIVENLKGIVLSCPTPFTIGLHGKWGTGKTTILDALKRRFYGTDTAAIKIDAWKHEGDALRRTFLQDTISQLQEKQGKKQYLGSDVKLSRNLRVPISRTFQSAIGMNRSFLKALGIISAVLVGVGFIIEALLPNNLGTYVSIVAGGGIIAAVLLWLLQQSITTETVTEMTDRFQDPQEFETEFKNIIDQVAANKLLIVVDNLDRVPCEKAVELLSTIKTFLEQKKCVFLIACDAEAIKKHLERQYEASTSDMPGVSGIAGDEFLRKFFNTYLVIPEFIDTELQTYTENLLEETGLSTRDLPDVAYVIAKAFRDNPRQIKQFINTLLSHFLLAKKREASGELLEGTVTNHTAYLAKDLVIRLEFPEYYETFTQADATSTESEKFNDFLRATGPIGVEDPRPFRYLKLSEEEIEIPEIRELQLAVQDNNVDSAIQVMSKIKADASKLATLNKFVSSLIDRNRGKELVLTNIVSSTLSALHHLEITLPKHFYQQVADLLGDDNQLATQIQNLDTSLIFSEVLSICSKARREEVIGEYTRLFSDPKRFKRDGRDVYIRDLMQAFIDHKDWLNSTRRQEISSAITEKHCNYEILSMFMGKAVEQKEFVNEKTLTQFINEISESDVEDAESLSRKLNLLSDFNVVVTDKNLAEMCTQFTAFLSTENTKPDRSQKHNLLACIDDHFNIFGKRITNLDESLIDPFAKEVLKGINTLGPVTQKRVFLPICLWLSRRITEPLRSQILSVIKTFFATGSPDGSPDDLRFVFDKIKEADAKEELISEYADIFKQRVLSDQAMFDSLYPLAGRDIRTDWFISLIQADHQRAIAKLEKLRYRVDDKKSVVSAILAKVNKIPLAQREGLYVACNNMRCANDVELRGQLVSYIKAHLKDVNPESQRIGLPTLQGATYLSQTHKRDIATDTVEWLSVVQPDSAYQPSSAQSLLVNWSVLTWAVKEKFLDYVFDKLIRRGMNSQSIDLGFNILGRVERKPEYEEYSAYFDDIFNRAVTESDPNVKSHLVKGLGSLQPRGLTKQNRDFWQKVGELLT